MAEIQDESIPEAPVIGVCMGKEQKGIQALNWALEKLIPPRGSIYVLHVKPPLRWIPNPMGGKFPINQVNPELVKRFKDDRFLETKKLFDQYRKICDKKKVTSNFCYSENDSVQKEIVDQISKLGITNLVLESSSQNVISKAFTRTESISAYVATHAPAFCTVMVVRKGKLYSVKDATQSSSFSCSSRSSISAESAISIETSMSGGETFEDHLLAGGGFQIGQRGIQTGVKDDPCNTSHSRLLQSVSMDISRGSAGWLNTDDVGYQGPTKPIMKRNYSTTPPFHQQPWSPLNYDNAQPISGWFAGRTSIASDAIASDASSLEESFPDSNSQGHEFTTPPRVPFEGIAGSSTSLTTNESFDRSLDTPELHLYPECEVLSHTSMEMEISTTLEGSSVQTSPMDSSTGFASNEVLVSLEFDLLQRQLIEARQYANREAERQANDFRMAEGVVANARKMIVEHERLRSEALNDAKIALQKASDYEKRWEDTVATLQRALRDQEILQERLAEEVRKHQETRNELQTQKRMVDAYASEADLANQQAQAEKDKREELLIKLEEVTKKLEEECRLRKEAEERASQEAIARRDAVVALQKGQQKYTEYTFQELQSATNNFHEENKLGQGGYGPVYKGKLHHTTVAIKVLARECLQGRAEFQKEVEVLSCIRHPHMVILLGACPEKGCIVYEYMANGSLEDRLSCRDGTTPLPWYARFRICLEVATALLFLHSCPHPIVHRDLKPGNILLDRHFVSKISDVGLAKLVPNNVTYSITMYKDTVPVGTLAYMDPDYQRTGVVSCASDVYSLGIVILQLLTGRQAVGVADLVEDAVDNNQLESVLDKSAGEWPFTEAMALACLGLECAEPRRKNRPNLEAKILPYLESIQSVPGIAAASMACARPSSSSTIPMIPSSFYCPISQDLMEDPHLAADGFTYEHDAIKTWLQEHDTSPMTNLVLSHKNLMPNLSIRSAIKEWYDSGLLKRHAL